MEQLLESGSKSVNTPKLTSSTFEMKNNYYVVTDGEAFNYYTIKVHPSDEAHPLIRFDRSPPILLEGIAIVGKKAYHVTIDDLFRRVIRKSREVKQEVKTNGTNRTSSRTTRKNSTAASSDINSPETLLNSNQQRVGEEAEVEIDQAADTTWSEQIGTLLSFISEKEGEEWEITEAP